MAQRSNGTRPQTAQQRAAQQRAAEIISTAQGQAREMRQTVTEYCDNMLRASEEQLARSAAEVKNVRTNLRQAAKNV